MAFRQPRLRLFDAVALAAGGLLVLKVTGLAFPSAAAPPVSPSEGFAGVLAHARTNYEPSDPATTNSTGHGAAPPPAAEPEPERPAGALPPAVLSSAPAMSPTEKALLERLGERRDAERQRNRDLDMREQILQDAERKIEGRIGDLKTLEDKAEAGGAKRAEGEGGLKNIVLMYETMKAKDAARVFDRLALDVLVPVVVLMNPRKMADVLGLMQSESAEKLTVALANRARGTADARTPTAEALPPNELAAIDPPAARKPAEGRPGPR